MRSLLFRDIRVTDCDGTRACDVLVKDGVIAACGVDLGPADRIIKAKRRALLPAFVDLHAHFRDPGLTCKEDLDSGSRAAAHGGYTYVNLMANTKPVCSSAAAAREVRERAAALGLCDVHQVVSVTRGFDGSTLAHLEELDGGVRWLSDDGVGIQDTGVMLRAMEAARQKGVGVMLHEEDSALTKVDPYLMEELMTFRDVALARLTGCKTHFCHVSTEKAMAYILEGKRDCAHITCEVTPHHLALSDETPGKVAPPLRGEAHRLFLVDCVKKGLVDAIATDHAPHTAQDKLEGANGFTGLDLAFATCYTTLVRGGHIPLAQLSRLMSRNPAKLMGLADRGRVCPGAPAHLVLADLDSSFVVDESCIHSRGKNTPLKGRTLYGEILMTLKEGTIVYEKTAD